MSRNGERRTALEGWDAIAAHLRVTKRTAQNYRAKYGLPVHQKPGIKGPVWAHAEELDEWLRQATYPQENPPQENPPPEGASDSKPAGESLAGDEDVVHATVGAPGFSTPRRRSGHFFVAAAAILLVLAAAAFVIAKRPRGPMSGIRRDGRDLVVLNEQRQELWRYRMPDSLHIGQYSNFESAGVSVFRTFDVDGDREPELLFFYLPPDFEQAGGSLYCFTSSGEVKWVFKPGREIADRRQRFSPSYQVRHVSVAREAATGGQAIVVSSSHTVHYPNQVAILDGNGGLRSEYWHSGHFDHMDIRDIDGDGRDEILLAGVNNGYRRATLVAMDLFKVNGCSVQPPGDSHQLQGCAPAKAKVIVRFGRTAFSERFFEYNRVMKMSPRPDQIEVFVSESIFQHAEHTIYQFDPLFNLLAVRPSDSLVSRYRALVASQQLDRIFGDHEIERLKRDLEVQRDFEGH